LTALAIFISKIDRRRSERTVRCPQSAGFAGNESARPRRIYFENQPPSRRAHGALPAIGRLRR